MNDGLSAVYKASLDFMETVEQLRQENESPLTILSVEKDTSRACGYRLERIAQDAASDSQLLQWGAGQALAKRLRECYSNPAWVIEMAQVILREFYQSPYGKAFGDVEGVSHADDR